MNSQKLKILFVAAEVAPFSSVGGLSQVLYYIPRALKSLGHDVRIFTPKFGFIDKKKFKLTMEFKGLSVPTDDKRNTHLICNVKTYRKFQKEPLIYFLENMEYYEKRANVYGYMDDHIRFALLSRGAIEFLKQSEWVPNIIHIHDWHTGYLANYMRTRYQDIPKLNKIPIVLTIHNLKHQGIFDFKGAGPLDFDDGKSPLASFFDPRLKKQNSLKRGIIYSDIVNTVSEKYSREILTKEYGEGLDQLLSEVRTKVYGVLNGIDNKDFNPKTDKIIKSNYSVLTINKRIENKIDLQKEFNLPVNPRVPILSYCGRLSDQKGLDLIAEVLPFLLNELKIQFILMGSGEEKYVTYFRNLREEYPENVGTYLLPNWNLPRKVFAGADILLLPSRFEPGGIVVMEGMRYGIVPIVRKTGGLADIVSDFDIENNKGTGFVLEKYNKLSFVTAIVRALEIYKCPKLWKLLMRRAMKEDFSWQTAVTKYLNLYTRVMELKKQQIRKGVLRYY